MTTEPHGPKKGAQEQVRCWLSLFLFVSWILGTPAIWVEFALAPVGTLATANAGRLVAIRGSNVITTSGYFQVSADPSAVRGTPMRIIRTNSMWSEGGLQLCTARGTGDDNWCNDIRDGFAGKLSKTPFAEQAWSQRTMITIFFLAFFVTLLGWFPAFAVSWGGGGMCSDHEEPASET